MKITVLIGNGFDVSFGLKSSYGDFYNWYCEKETKITHIAKFRKEIKDDISRDVPDDEKTWADFELGLGQYTSNFDKNTVEQFLDCLEDAEENIRTYLIEQETKFDLTHYTEQSIKDFPKSLINFYDEVSDLGKISIKSMLDSVQNENREISFITFNYTGTLERIIDKISDQALYSWRYSGVVYSYLLKRNVIHVHGKIDEFPILGVNDETQIANKALLDTPQFKELMLKANNVQALGKMWHNQAEEQISNSRVVCILGMSIGASDTKWWRKLVQWLKASDRRHIILYWYEKNPPNGISSRKQLRAENKAKERLLSFSELSDNEVSTLKKRIHVVINTSKFLHLEKTEEYRQKEKRKSVETIMSVDERVEALEKKVESMPQIYVSKEEPEHAKEGDVWLQPV